MKILELCKLLKLEGILKKLYDKHYRKIRADVRVDETTQERRNTV